LLVGVPFRAIDTDAKQAGELTPHGGDVGGVGKKGVGNAGEHVSDRRKDSHAEIGGAADPDKVKVLSHDRRQM